jgi:outer membrane protein assembly factor BamB
MSAASCALLGLGALLSGADAPGRTDNWPGFRGPTGLGYTEDRNLPLNWGGPDHGNVCWQAPLKGQGHASPIVWKDRVFVCTVSWPPMARREQVIPDHHVTCYRATDGQLLWDTLIPAGPWLRTDFRSGAGGGYAAPTPATDGHYVFCAFGSSVLAALDFQGKIVWRTEIIPHTFDVTIGSSPVLYNDTLILFCAMAQRRDSRVVAYGKADGIVRWQQPLPSMAFGHSTPLLIRVNQQPQMLVLASGMSQADRALQSLDPATGKLLWWCRGAGDAASPAFGNGLVYFDSGRGGVGFAVDPTGSGDVSASHVRWSINLASEALSSPVIVEGRLYRLLAPGIVKCWDMTKGKLLYSERLPGISSTWASPIADPEGRLFFATAGKSYVLQAGPKFQVLAVNDLGDGNHASPAAAQGKLYFVGMNNLYCVGKRHRE